MNLPLCYFGNPILREKAKPVTTFDTELEKLGNDMIATMREEAGIGLAGPQIGKSLRIFTMEVPPEMDEDEKGQPHNPGLESPLVVVNPEIEIVGDDEEEMEEGCLSIPEVRGKVTRPFAIKLRYQNVKGEEKALALQGLAARCVQHETDHLNGVLFIDYLSSVKKMSIKGKLKRIKQNYG
ncbi:peptide deformylase [Kiritimatiellaeota bacterium B1221]|nr:peptide deformylase [Kiritimatiellaeota bacterium B1221]